MATVEIPLQLRTDLPSELRNLEISQVCTAFPSPTLIDINGREKQPVFLSLLLHGNETTSFYVLKKLQSYLEDHTLPRRLVVFVGNVYAAEENKRLLEGQQDYNRVWQEGMSAEHDLARRVKQYAAEHGPLFANIDIHNNTGANPFYACINNLDPTHIYLGSLFTRTLVYFKNPSTAQSIVFSEMCPSVTLECGPSGSEHSVEKAFQFVLDVLHLQNMTPAHGSEDSQIYQTKGRIILKNFVDYDFSFERDDASLRFPSDFEKWNFAYLEPGELFARYRGEVPPFFVKNDDNQDVFDEYFILASDEIRVRKAITPSMFTQNKDVIRQDCLGYIMEPISK